MRPADLLEAGPRRRAVPRRYQVGAAAVVLAVGLAGIGWREQAQRRAADVVDLRIETLPVQFAGADLLQLTFTVVNRGPAARLLRPAVDGPGYEVVDSPTPERIAGGSEGAFGLRVRPVCPPEGVPPLLGSALRLQLPVVPPSGAVRVQVLSLDRREIDPLAERACGVLSPAEAGELDLAQRVHTNNGTVAFLLPLRNRSREVLRLVRVTAAGLAVHADPTSVPPGGTALVPVTVRVANCALIPNGLTASLMDALPPGALSVELTGPSGQVDDVGYRPDPGDELHAQLTALVLWRCGAAAPDRARRLPARRLLNKGAGGLPPMINAARSTVG